MLLYEVMGHPQISCSTFQTCIGIKKGKHDVFVPIKQLFF